MAQVVLRALSNGGKECSPKALQQTFLWKGVIMIEVNPLNWKLPRHKETFSCFIRGCHHQAGYVAKFKTGDIIVQVCLCDECLRKSPKVILESLGIGSEKILN
jgi:hypothetical protein